MKTFRRLFWMALGAGAAYYALRRIAALGELRRQLTSAGRSGEPDGAGGALAGLRDFADTVREGMARRELELREALTADQQP